MDVFALGCVLAELLTDAPLFRLADLVAFRREGERSPHTQARGSNRWGEGLRVRGEGGV